MVKRAHRHQQFIADPLHIQQDLRWVFFEQGSGKTTDHEQGITITNAPLSHDQRSEVRGQRSEVRGQRSEVRGQRSEVRGQRSEVRNQSVGAAICRP
ncbi:MAG: hypothetical protein FWC38_08350 [Proteobacteria bacterium]|nr:hypothetical protein [Pseudomonadota bacterium]